MDSYRFNLSFRGQLVENSVDAFDVANTILATSSALQEIATEKFGEEVSQKLQLSISAFNQGSLVSGFVYHLADGVAAATVAGSALLPYAGNVVEIGGKIVDGLKTYVELKKLLKGKPPKSAKAIEGGKIEMTMGDNNTVIINYNDFRLLQSQTLAKNIAKATQPLRKEDSLVEEIDIGQGVDTTLTINKGEAPYFEPTDAFQTLPSVRYRGMVTKIDSKVRSGYISVGTKRIPFTYPENLSEEKFIILVESLKRRIQIILIGDVTMDYESNPRSIAVSDVESEIRLF